VAWEAGIRHLLGEGFVRFIELGPGKALSGFLRRINRDAQALNVADLPSLNMTVGALAAPPSSLSPAA
jgi:[acyl-carrier-protein] S-malonyltransferase